MSSFDTVKLAGGWTGESDRYRLQEKSRLTSDTHVHAVSGTLQKRVNLRSEPLPCKLQDQKPPLKGSG